LKVKELIEKLEAFDPEKRIVFYEMLDYYDTIFIALSEDDDSVKFNVANIVRGTSNKDKIKQ